MNMDSAYQFLAAAYIWLAAFAQSPVLLEYFKTVIDLIKGVAWPAALLMIVFMFKAEFRPLIERIIKLGPGGVEIGPRLAEKQGQAEVSDPDVLQSTAEGELKELPGRWRSDALAIIEHKLHRSLSDLIESGKIERESQIDFLVNELAITRLVGFFDRIYSLIFGSQIRGLIHLNQFGSATIAEARELYEQSKAADPEFYGDYSFESWLGFLKDNDLIAADDSKLRLTPLGQDFVRYLNLPGRVLAKRG